MSASLAATNSTSPIFSNPASNAAAASMFFPAENARDIFLNNGVKVLNAFAAMADLEANDVATAPVSNPAANDAVPAPRAVPVPFKNALAKLPLYIAPTA